jgi:hypothetical protein
VCTRVGQEQKTNMWIDSSHFEHSCTIYYPCKFPLDDHTKYHKGINNTDESKNIQRYGVYNAVNQCHSTARETTPGLQRE